MPFVIIVCPSRPYSCLLGLTLNLRFPQTAFYTVSGTGIGLNNRWREDLKVRGLSCRRPVGQASPRLILLADGHVPEIKLYSPAATASIRGSLR